MDATTRAAFPAAPAVLDWQNYTKGAEHITIEPLPGKALTFTRTAVMTDSRYVSWFGTCPEYKGATLNIVASSDAQTSVIRLPGVAQFTVNTSKDGRTTISQSQSGLYGCSTDGAQLPMVAADNVPLTPVALEARYQAAAAMLPEQQERFGPLEADASTLIVGVLFLYQEATVTAAKANDASDPVGFIDRYSKACIDWGNSALMASLLTNFQWKYLGAILAPAYTRPANVNIDYDLSQISGITGGLSSWTSQQADKYGAGQIVMWNSGDEPGATYGGMARMSVTQANDSRSVVVWMGSVPPPMDVSIHEMGHNFGCTHDRLSIYGTGSAITDNDGYYNYGFMTRYEYHQDTFVLPVGTTRQDFSNGNVTFTEPDGTKVYSWSKDMGYGSGVLTLNSDGSGTVVNTRYNTIGTIMAYAGGIIGYFSNPNVTVHLVGSLSDRFSTGDWGTQPIGVDRGQPKAAYNAKVMLDAAARISSFGSGITLPAITLQPQGQSVSSGAGLTLSVTATGGNLSYQWSLNGSALSGATSASFSKSAAASGDAGDYTVTVSNQLGSVTSNKATVSVTASPSPAPAASGGGGGGGGAPSVFFLGGLACLIFLRLIRRP